MLFGTVSEKGGRQRFCDRRRNNAGLETLEMGNDVGKEISARLKVNEDKERRRFHVGLVLRRRRFDLVVSSLHLCQLTGPEDFLNDCGIPSLDQYPHKFYFLAILTNFKSSIT